MIGSDESEYDTSQEDQDDNVYAAALKMSDRSMQKSVSLMIRDEGFETVPLTENY